MELSGLPVAETLDELAEKIAEIVREPRLREELEKLSWRCADRYSFYDQAKKHLLLEETLSAGMRLPVLDGEPTDDLHTGKISRGKFGGFGESWRGDRLHTHRR